ncbi:unnamed protein product [Onchocerca flexuosa]|uniref:Uncharacterized protein n=1 Tax=Onchocerca flexuosa TaxID=387005 RepID=A0A183I6J1_9BILA|nr:unnamed protein product [Onchocerca flexuosa]
MTALIYLVILLKLSYVSILQKYIVKLVLFMNFSH